MLAKACLMSAILFISFWQVAFIYVVVAMVIALTIIENNEKSLYYLIFLFCFSESELMRFGNDFNILYIPIILCGLFHGARYIILSRHEPKKIPIVAFIILSAFALYTFIPFGKTTFNASASFLMPLFFLFLFILYKDKLSFKYVIVFFVIGFLISCEFALIANRLEVFDAFDKYKYERYRFQGLTYHPNHIAYYSLVGSVGLLYLLMKGEIKCRLCFPLLLLVLGFGYMSVSRFIVILFAIFLVPFFVLYLFKYKKNAIVPLCGIILCIITVMGVGANYSGYYFHRFGTEMLDFGNTNPNDPKEFTITIPEFAHGVITTEELVVMSGTVVKLVVEPEEGYILKSGTLKYNSSSINFDATKGYAFVMPYNNVTIAATFIEKQEIIITPPPPPPEFVYITIAPLQNGTITISPIKETYLLGDKITISVTPASGYRLRSGSLLYNGTAIVGDSFIIPQTITTSTIQIKATFDKIYAWDPGRKIIWQEALKDWASSPKSILFGKGLAANDFHDIVLGEHNTVIMVLRRLGLVGSALYIGVMIYLLYLANNKSFRFRFGLSWFVALIIFAWACIENAILLKGIMFYLLVFMPLTRFSKALPESSNQPRPAQE